MIILLKMGRYPDFHKLHMIKYTIKKKKTAKKASKPEPGPEIVPDRQTGGDSGR